LRRPCWVCGWQYRTTTSRTSWPMATDPSAPGRRARGRWRWPQVSRRRCWRSRSAGSWPSALPIWISACAARHLRLQVWRFHTGVLRRLDRLLPGGLGLGCCRLGFRGELSLLGRWCVGFTNSRHFGAAAPPATHCRGCPCRRACLPGQPLRGNLAATRISAPHIKALGS
jgi:hypothetical protein